ncbi:unnamed protein product [Dicrocoelium dendriticum]|nr:unnamed protein product [Dicrocoelium dendriticum]
MPSTEGSRFSSLTHNFAGISLYQPTTECHHLLMTYLPNDTLPFRLMYRVKYLPLCAQHQVFQCHFLLHLLVLCFKPPFQLSYAIGIAEPLSIYLDSYGTSSVSNKELLHIVERNFDLRPGVIVKELDLRCPRYLETAVYGHFGRPEFPWEQCKKLRL